MKEKKKKKNLKTRMKSGFFQLDFLWFCVQENAVTPSPTGTRGITVIHPGSVLLLLHPTPTPSCPGQLPAQPGC